MALSALPLDYLRSHWRHLLESKALLGQPEVAEYTLAECPGAHSVQDEVRRLNHGAGGAIGMAWGGHCAVAKCTPLVLPLPTAQVPQRVGECQLHYLQCCHDPRQGDYLGSQACCTQRKRSTNPGIQTLHLSHTPKDTASQVKTLGVGDTQSHTEIHMGCYKHSDSPH